MKNLPIFSTITASSVRREVQAAISLHCQEFDSIGSSNAHSVSVERLGRIDTATALKTGPLLILAMVSSNEEIRKEATEGKRSLQTLFKKEYSRPDVAKAVRWEADRETDEQTKRLGTCLYSLFKRNGALLEDSFRLEEIAKLQTRQVDLCSSIETAINADCSYIELTREELDGVPDAALNSYTVSTNSSNLQIGFKAPQLVPVLSYAKSSQVRKRVLQAANKRCQEENENKITELLQVRKQLARLLGYSSHSELQLGDKMAGSPEIVQNLLQKVQQKLFLRSQGFLQRLMKLKQSDSLVTQEGKEENINVWDVRYYIRKMKDEEYSIDENLVQQYFPLEHVREEVLKLYGEVLGLTFIKLSDVDVWHEDVDVFEMKETSTNKVLGHLYMDLFSRPGKYQHQCVVPLRPGIENECTPACAIIGNLGKLSDTSPALLRFAEVTTLLHELGHVVHCLSASSMTKYSFFAWTWPIQPWPGGLGDFLEVPSMMFQFWLDDPKVIERLSKHHQTGEKIPLQLAEDIAVVQYLDSDYTWARFIAMSQLDLEMHSENPPKNIPVIWKNLLYSAIGLDEIEGTNFTNTWYHPIQGYDALYYSYLWSELVARDMFSEFEKDGILNSNIGIRFRQQVLQPSSTLDGNVIASNFLGRPFTDEAFFKSLDRQTQKLEFISTQKKKKKTKLSEN